MIVMLLNHYFYRDRHFIYFPKKTLNKSVGIISGITKSAQNSHIDPFQRHKTHKSNQNN